MKRITILLFAFVFASFAMKAQDPAFDDFERSGGLGTNWTIYFGGSDITIIWDSDIGIANGPTRFGIAAWTGSTFSADQYSEGVISPEKIDSMWAQVFVRRRTSDFARYAFHWSDRDGNAPGGWDIKYDGVPTPQVRVLDSLASPPPLPGDTIRIEVTTNTLTGYPEIKGYLNGNLMLTAIDSAATKIMNGEPGMAFRFRVGFPASYPSKVFEEWRGGSLNTSTGTEETIAAHNISSLYPNPATSVLYIKESSSLPSVLELYDITGQKLLSEKLSADNRQINITGLARGIYFYKVIAADNSQENGKIIVE